MPRRGSVVVLEAPDDPGRWDVKRLIGLPGELIEWQAGQFSINGTPLQEPYARLSAQGPGDHQESRTVRLGPREYFVAGDNRPSSRDSRHYGPVSRNRLVAEAERA